MKCAYVGEINDLEGWRLGASKCAEWKQKSPRAIIRHFLKLSLVYQQYCVVPGRFCGERVTGNRKF